MNTSTLPTTPVSVALICAGDVVRYGNEIYYISGYIHYAVLDGGVLLANRAAEGGGWCPTQVALPFPNMRSEAELVTGGLA